MNRQLKEFSPEQAFVFTQKVLEPAANKLSTDGLFRESNQLQVSTTVEDYGIDGCRTLYRFVAKKIIQDGEYMGAHYAVGTVVDTPLTDEDWEVSAQVNGHPEEEFDEFEDEGVIGEDIEAEKVVLNSTFLVFSILDTDEALSINYTIEKHSDRQIRMRPADEEGPEQQLIGFEYHDIEDDGVAELAIGADPELAEIFNAITVDSIRVDIEDVQFATDVLRKLLLFDRGPLPV